MTQAKCSWGPAVHCALNFWAASFWLHMVIVAWRDLHPSSHSYAATAWVLHCDNWWWRIYIEAACLGVTNWLADRQQANMICATSAADYSPAININVSPSSAIFPAHLPSFVPADSTESNTAAQLASHAGAIAAILVGLGPTQQTAANESYQQATPTQIVDSQAQDTFGCLVVPARNCIDMTVLYDVACLVFNIH